MKIYEVESFLNALTCTPAKLLKWSKEFSPRAKKVKTEGTARKYLMWMSELVKRAKLLDLKTPEFDLSGNPEAITESIKKVEKLIPEVKKALSAKLSQIAKEKDEFVNLDLHGRVRDREAEKKAIEAAKPKKTSTPAKSRTRRKRSAS